MVQHVCGRVTGSFTKEYAMGKVGKLEKAISFYCEITSLSDGEPATLTGGSFINGDVVRYGEAFDVLNPATGEKIGSCSETTPEDIDRAFCEARSAQFYWRHCVSSQEKRAVFEHLWLLIAQYKEEFAVLYAHESGKVITSSRADIVECIDTIKAAYSTLHDEGGTYDEAQLACKHAATVPWEYGVELAIKPFNFAAIYFWKVAASVMSGCAVIVKEAEQVPFTGLCMTALFHKALRNALGIECAHKLCGLVQLLQGRGETVGKYAVENGDYDLVSATGSWQMGSSVASVAARKIRPQKLELSGHNRILQWFDYPVEKAAEEVVLAAFGDSGQRCVSAKAVFTPRALFKETIAEIVRRAKSLRIGDPQDPTTDIGPIVSAEQLETIQRAVAEVLIMGISPALGGYALNPFTVDRALAEGFTFAQEDFREGGRFARGYWFVPTVFTNITMDRPIMRYEAFGPVVVLNELEWAWRESLGGKDPIQRNARIYDYMHAKGIEGLAHAELFLRGMELLNDNLFGLSCAFLSYDVRYLVHFIELAQYGLRYCGRGTTGAEVDARTVFGGGKNSGYGREGGSVKHARTVAQVYFDASPRTRLAQRDI